MRAATVAAVMWLGVVLAHVGGANAQPFPSSGSPNPAMTAGRAGDPAPVSAPSEAPAGAAAAAARAADASPPPNATVAPLLGTPPDLTPRAVTVARATAIPNCTMFVDAAGAAGGAGTAQKPHKTVTAAVAAAKPGAVICVAEGTYAEQLNPREKPITLAGGFQSGQAFKVRDSATYVSKAVGRGGSFIRIEDPAPKGDQLTAIDGFDISGYSQAIFRDGPELQRFSITNNHIHDNRCTDDKLVGAAFSLNNTSTVIVGNVIRKNACGRGGGGAVYDDLNNAVVVVANNLVEANAGTEPDSSHGGGLYLFANNLTVTGNMFLNNTVTQWGGGLFIGAWTEGGKYTNAKLNWNVYRGNKAGNSGGGFFCDENATCLSEHEIYVSNCGGNILLDGGSDNSAPGTASFDNITNVGALDPTCKALGDGVLITKGGKPAATYTFRNALFWGNAPGRDFAAICDNYCANIRVSVVHSMVQTEHAKQNMSVTFGPGILAPADPLFANVEKGDFHLKSAAGRWTPTGYVKDAVTSPAIGKGDPAGKSDAKTGRPGQRSELGAYGNSSEASYAH